MLRIIIHKKLKKNTTKNLANKPPCPKIIYSCLAEMTIDIYELICWYYLFCRKFVFTYMNLYIILIYYMNALKLIYPCNLTLYINVH